MGRLGQQLLDLHIGYEKAKPFKFTRLDTPDTKRARGSHPKPQAQEQPDEGLVIVDEDTQFTGIPREAWDYRLGNRSAIDWVLDQHKEKTPRDPTVREKFNTYRFADYKESMIDLLARVITVSLETVKLRTRWGRWSEGTRMVRNPSLAPLTLARKSNLSREGRGSLGKKPVMRSKSAWRRTGSLSLGLRAPPAGLSPALRAGSRLLARSLACAVCSRLTSLAFPGTAR